MQGIRVNGTFAKSKKAVKEAVANGDRVRLVATSFFGNEYDGNVLSAPDGMYFFVGPDENTRRSSADICTADCKSGRISFGIVCIKQFHYFTTTFPLLTMT